MKIKYTLLLAAVVGVTAVNAQQLPLFSQYYYNPFLYNPGFAGTSEKANMYLVHRSQWKDMPGAPVTYALTLDGPVVKDKVGMGISLFSDQTDMIQRIGISGAYSYKIRLSGDHYLHPGIALGASDNRFDFTRANVHDANDPMLLAQNRRKVTFDANFGLAYIWKDLRIGFSVPQIFGNKVNFVDAGENQVYLRLTRHFLTSVMYRIAINEEWDVTPSVMARAAKGTPFQMDVNAMVGWKNMIRGGISYRLGYAIGLSAGVRLYNNVVAGYCYDASINSVKAYTGGGHEILLGYTFGGGGGGNSGDDSKIREMENKLESSQLQSDSMINNLKKTNARQNEEIENLKKEMNELKKTGGNTDTNPNTNGNNTNTANKVDSTKTNPEEPNKNIRAEKLSDYTDENGQPIEQGYYVVVESFKSAANAQNNKKFYEQQKNIKVKTIFNKVRKFYYNSVLYTSDEESAIDVMNEVKKEKPDAWIFKLMEE